MSDIATIELGITPEGEECWVVVCWCGELGTLWTSPRHAAAQANRFDNAKPECVHMQQLREQRQ